MISLARKNYNHKLFAITVQPVMNVKESAGRIILVINYLQVGSLDDDYYAGNNVCKMLKHMD